MIVRKQINQLELLQTLLNTSSYFDKILYFDNRIMNLSVNAPINLSFGS